MCVTAVVHDVLHHEACFETQHGLPCMLHGSSLTTLKCWPDKVLLWRRHVFFELCKLLFTCRNERHQLLLGEICRRKGHNNVALFVWVCLCTPLPLGSICSMNAAGFCLTPIECEDSDAIPAASARKTTRMDGCVGDDNQSGFYRLCPCASPPSLLHQGGRLSLILRPVQSRVSERIRIL